MVAGGRVATGIGGLLWIGTTGRVPIAISGGVHWTTHLDGVSSRIVATGLFLT
jgi:hypothetical protein